MAGNKDIPRVKNPPSGDGHHVTHRFMTATELAAREARQNAYDAMLARQDAFERSREVVAKKHEAVRAGPFIINAHCPVIEIARHNPLPDQPPLIRFFH